MTLDEVDSGNTTPTTTASPRGGSIIEVEEQHRPRGTTKVAASFKFGQGVGPAKRCFAQQRKWEHGPPACSLFFMRERGATASPLNDHAGARRSRFSAQRACRSAALPLPRSTSMREHSATASTLNEHAGAQRYRFPSQQACGSEALPFSRSTSM